MFVGSCDMFVGSCDMFVGSCDRPMPEDSRQSSVVDSQQSMEFDEGYKQTPHMSSPARKRWMSAFSKVCVSYTFYHLHHLMCRLLSSSQAVDVVLAGSTVFSRTLSYLSGVEIVVVR